MRVRYVGVACWAVARVLGYGCSPGSNSGGDSWQLQDASNPIDGEVVKASKQFVMADQFSRIGVDITCTTKSKELTIEVSSYQDKANNKGGYDASPLVQDD